MQCRCVVSHLLRNSILLFNLQHFGFQPEELADEFSQSTIDLLGSVIYAMKSKVGKKRQQQTKKYKEMNSKQKTNKNVGSILEDAVQGGPCLLS